MNHRPYRDLSGNINRESYNLWHAVAGILMFALLFFIIMFLMAAFSSPPHSNVIYDDRGAELKKAERRLGL